MQVRTRVFHAIHACGMCKTFDELHAELQAFVSMAKLIHMRCTNVFMLNVFTRHNEMLVCTKTGGVFTWRQMRLKLVKYVCALQLTSNRYCTFINIHPQCHVLLS